MARTILILTPENARLNEASPPEIKEGGNGHLVLAFDASTVETAIWTAVAPQGLTADMVGEVSYRMASATSGKVDWELSIEAITDDDALDTDTTDSFAAVNAADETVPGTAGYMSQLAITFTNDDSIAAGDMIRIKLERDADDGTDDTAAGDAELLVLEIKDGV